MADATDACTVHIPPGVRACSPSAVAEVVAAAVERLGRLGFVRLAISDLGVCDAEGHEVAVRLMGKLRDRLVAVGAPETLRLERRPVEGTPVPPGAETRLLLPHTDGAHATYITPSVRDVDWWRSEWRRHGDSLCGSSDAHKVYQGFRVVTPGANSETAYYSSIVALSLAYKIRRGRPPPDLPTLAAFLADNLRRAQETRPSWLHPNYFPQAAIFGARDLRLWAIAPETAEGELDLSHLPDQAASDTIPRQCSCEGDGAAACGGASGRYLCWAFRQTLGLSWPDFRTALERSARTKAGDVLIGENVTMLHAGLHGDRSRTIEPLFLVIDAPVGDTYEAWLFNRWRAACHSHALAAP